jgi:hypothetical protein
LTIGTYNLNKSETAGTPSSTSWVSADPLLEIGNGTSSTHSDALVVYKDGDVAAKGNVTAPTFVTAAPSGDIPMFAGY